MKMMRIVTASTPKVTMILLAEVFLVRFKTLSVKVEIKRKIRTNHCAFNFAAALTLHNFASVCGKPKGCSVPPAGYLPEYIITYVD